MQDINPEVYETNMMSLSLRYPEIASKINNCDVINFKLFKQEKCIANIISKTLNKPWYEGRIDKFCDKHWRQIDFKNIKNAVFLGFGLGYEVGYFLKTKGIGTLNSIIIIERDLEVFKLAMRVTDLRDLINNPEITFIIGVPQEKIYNTLINLFRQNMKTLLLQGSTKFVFTKMPFLIDKEYYSKVIQNYQETGFAILNSYGNDPDDSLVGLENMLDNLKQITSNPGINLLYDKFKNKPAVIVATGPSLNKNMHLLKGLEDKALILSVDASFKYLLNNNIKPHMVTSLEREHEVQSMFDNLDKEEVKDVFMTACPVLFNHVYESYNGPKIIVYREYDHFKWLGIDKGMLDIKLSSANMAFKIAHHLGCDPIILIGQDLAYGENENDTHATAVPFSSEGEAKFEVPGNIEKMVKTNSGWYGFLKAFEIDIAQYNGKVINCTEGGAYISGTYKVDTFENTIKQYLTNEFDVIGTIRENLNEFNSQNDDDRYIKELVDKTEKEIDIIIDLCTESIKNHAEFMVNIKKIDNVDEQFKLFNEYTKNRITITTEYFNTYQYFLMHVIQSVHLSFELGAAMDCNSVIEISEIYINWYKKVKEITKICKKSLLKAKSKLLS